MPRPIMLDTITFLYGLNSKLKPLDPETATDAFPGSEEKIRIMEERYLRGQAIFHAQDRNDRTQRSRLAQPASEPRSFGRG